MTLGSLFDGIGGFPLAATISGIMPVWASEIEPFCIAVTKKHFPNMVHLGDITKIDGRKIPPVDIITFGSPCQNMSVAGDRTGLEGDQSRLFYEAIRIIYEMREATNGAAPTYIVWENVPGAFSSNGGRDFQAVLSEVTKANIPMPRSGRWANAGVVRGGAITFAWRLLDAQYWGVPQRRKRIYAVGSFGSRSAEEILFKPESVSGDYSPCGEAGQGPAAATDGSAEQHDTARRSTVVFDGSQITCPTNKSNPNINAQVHTLSKTNANSAILCIINDRGGESITVEKDSISPTLRAQSHGNLPVVCVRERCGCEGGGKGCLVQENITGTLATNNDQFVVCAAGFCPEQSAKTRGIGYEEEKSPTLRTGVVPGCIYAIDRAAFNQGTNAQCDFEISDKGIASTLVVKGPSEVAYGISSDNSNAMKSPNPHSGIYEAKTARTLDCNGGNPCCNQGGVVIVQPAYAIGNGQSNQTGTELSDRSGTLNCMHDQQEVIYPTETKFWEAYQHHGYRQSESAGTLTMGQNDHVRGDTPIITQSYGANCRNDTLNEELYPTLQAKESGGQSLNYSGVLLQKIWCWIARRLIPLECGRLQGYPDHWTDIGPWTDDKGKLHKESSDTSQYRAYGNSIAVPCGLRVIGAIAEYERSKKPCLTTLHYRAALPATRN